MRIGRISGLDINLEGEKIALMDTSGNCVISKFQVAKDEFLFNFKMPGGESNKCITSFHLRFGTSDIQYSHSKRE